MTLETEIVRRALRKGVNLSPEALSFLSKFEDDELERILDSFSDRLVIGIDDLLTLIHAEKSSEEIRESEEEPKSLGDLSVILRPTGLGVRGTSEEFVKLIRLRFEKLKSILLRRVELEPIPITELKSSASRNGDNIVIIGMVMEKITARDKSIRMSVEDETGSITVVFKRESKYWELADKVPIDSVIAVRGAYVNGKIYAESLMLPDLNNGEVEASYHEGKVVLISDVHVGSKYFNESVFERFLKWLKSEHAIEIKYLLICGDLVDGIGVYPNQEEELRIADVHKQFEYAGELLSRVPERIKLIYIPGNHEPVRQAEPQNELPRDYLETLVEANPNILHLPNPAMIKIGAVKLLLYHGRSLNALMKHIPGLQPVTPQTVVEAMSWVLRLRNLAPIYGEHPLSPEERDWLTLEEVPNVIHMGHIHVYGVGEYRSVKLINSGTFENETPYIKSLGIEVTVGKVPVLDLKNLNVELLDFS